MFLILALGSLYTIMYQNVSATGDEIVSNTIEINDLTADALVLSNDDYFGQSITNIGDLNNDGTLDIAVGAYFDDTGGTNRGAINVMLMNSNGTVSNTIEINDLTTNGPVLSNDDYFGISIANIGDLNGDGVLDIAVGALDDAGGTSRGAIHVMLMNSNGTVSRTIEINDLTTNGPVLSNDDYFGISIANIGDLNGDGVLDIAVGASGDDAGGTSRGAIHVMLMNSNGTVSRTIEINDLTANGPDLSNSDHFGISIANIGDLNNDGTLDIAVGAYFDDAGGTNRGAIHVMLMNSNGTVSNTIEINDLTANGPVLSNDDYFGISIANIGDLNSDGILDIAVGASGDSTGGTSRGVIHVMLMNSNGTVSRTIEINGLTANGPDLSSYDYFGISIANIGDLNSDGVLDIAVGASGDDTGGTNRGAIHVMLMNSNGTVSRTIEINDLTANGPDLSNSDNFGQSLANIGDLNGDGILDIAVGAYYDDAGGTSRGAIYVMLMNRDGIISRTIEINNLTANGPDLSNSDNFGISIANIGDLNNDGILDIAVGASDDDAGGTNKGAIHVMLMNSNGTVSRTIEINDLTANGPVLFDGDAFGISIANIGDLNNDGVLDIAVGASGDDAGGTSRGAIHVMLMNSNGTVSNTIEINNLTANGPDLSNSDNFGQSLANIGDLNGDGVLDIAVGASGDDAGGTSRGAIHVMLMNSNGTVSSTTKIDSNTSNGPVLSNSDHFGRSIANIGDLNNDGVLDIAVGATGDDAGGPNKGAIHVMLMNSNRSVLKTIEINDLTANGPVLSNSDNFGRSIANIGDLDNDSTLDIAVGAYYDDTGGTDRGAIHVLFMNSVDTTLPTIINITSNTTTFGVLKVGDTISFTLTLTSAENGATINSVYNSVPLFWSSIDNGTTYTATYTISEGDTDQITPLQITGVTITDSAGNTSLPYDGTDILDTIDANSPQFSSAQTLSVSQIVITLDHNVTNSAATPTDFVLGGVTDGSINSIVSVFNNTITLGIADATISDSDDVTISYTRTSGSIDDVSGNSLLNFAENVTNTLNTPPIIILNGANPQIIEQGAGYTELNATTNDGSPVTIDSANFTDAVGTYHIYYDSTDTAGNNAIQVNRTVIVSDTTPPVISLTGENPQTIERGAGYTELNATTNDGSPVTIDSANFTDAVGTYHIYYDSTDTAGNNAIQVNRTVIVSDTTPPVISLTGENPQTIERGAGYTELNATTNDGSPVTIDSANFTDAVGNYTIYYDSTDTAGNNAIQVNRTVIVSDTTPPTFSSAVLNEGTGIFTVTFSETINTSSINSTGFSIRDNNNNTSTGAITLSNLELTTTANGTTISFNMTLTNRQSVIAFNVSVLDIGAGAVQDINGNAITLSANNTITTTLDSIPPVISLIGDNPQIIEQGAGYTELNATTNDGSPVTIDSANFTDAVGTYHIYYDSTDTAGNNAIQVNRTVTVSDTTPPVISLIGDNPQTIERGAGYTELNATTNDGSPVTINSANFTDAVGTYYIYYDSTDTAGNNAIQVNRTVNVVDTTPPVITLNGTNPQIIEQGAGYTELNATTNDGSPVTINSANFTDLVGTYYIYYDSTDTAGNNAIQVNRTVNVVDTTPPVITLNGTNPQIIEQGAGYTELNATTNDGSPVTINSANFTDLVGTYHIYYDSTDTAGNNAIQVNRTVTVSDTTPPVITLIGENPQTIEQGAGYTELNATTNDGSPVTINSANFTDLVGTYHIYYDSTDTAGNNAIQVNRTVNVVDTTPPVITLNGTNPQIIEQGAGYTELNATTNDGSPVTINSANFTDLVGTYHIYYDSTDTAGNNAIQVNRTVNVVDTTPPVITLNGENPQTIERGAGYTELNATTNDGSPVTIDSANFTDLVGTYHIYYDSTDTAGNNAIQVNRTVNVVDTTPPVITLNGENPQTIEQGAGYTELNATTNDGSPVTIDSANFTDLVGTYHIYYDSTDTAGNNAIQVNRTVNVVDTTPPVITLNGENPQTIEQGAGYTELNATTNDGSPVTINSANFTDLVGTYHIYYDSTDTAGNNAIQVNRTVNVVDTTPPVITLNGTNPQIIEQGAGYTELNATTSDGSPVTINSANFTDLVGTYHIYYDSTDTAGNNAIQVNRTVNVVDTTPPVITLNGENPQTIEQGAGYTELNATTSDGSPVTINSANFTDLVGTYHIYYDSTDTAGNNAIQINRTVNVVDTTPPVITLNGENPQTIEQGAGYTELNATTSDGSPVTINSANFTDLVGTYHIYYDSTDTAGNNAIQVNRTVNVVDTTPPVITLNGTNPQIIEQGAGYTELNATTSDGSPVTINSANFTDLVGTYHIYYDSTDTAGNNAIQVNRTVNVVDTTPPVITLNGTNPQIIEQGAGYTELNATTNDGSPVTINSANFTDLVGTYHIYYDSTDTAGNNAIQVNRTVNVVDTTPPVITLNGTNPQIIEQGAGYTELNATTSDGSPVTINSANFTDLVGTYHIYYDSTDTAGNNAIQVNRTVTVSDTTPPVISLIGENPQTIELGDGYTELNATTNDGSTITINSANFTDAVGTYHIYYDSTDTAGNNAIQVNRTVTVSDTTPPTFSSAVLNEGTGIFTVTFSETINTSSINSTGFSIRDNNTSTDVITLSTLELTTTANGTTISFNMTLTNRQSVIAFNVSVLDISAGAVQDINGNAITLSANNTITTTLDSIPPVISLIGENPQTIEQGAGYTELNATTNDGSTITINSANFTDAVGTYYIYYDSTDTAGNNAIQVNRTVTVSDTTPPVISLIGENPQTIEQGAGYTELNATTNDGSPVTINSANFTDAVGTYHIYYDSTDTAGNNAIQVNRTVTVSDTTPPVITLNGTNPQIIEQGAGYTELNATTSDGSPVTINSANFTDAVGTYHIYYDSTDTAGNNAIQVNRTVTVSDTTPPTFSSAVLNEGTGIFTVTFSETINTSSINSTGFSIRDNNTSTDVITLSTLELTTTANGTTISFNMTLTNRQSVIAFNVSVLDISAGAVQDINGNAITLSANNIITTTLDSIPPVISLIGENPQTIEQGAGYTELNATTNDGSTITINSANFTDAVGTYHIYYDSTDTAGNNAIQVNRTVTVSDTTPPVISLIGENPQTIEQGAGYTELNATTNDGSTITINSANFTDLVGTYHIYYDSTDTAGNNAIQVNRTVTVSDTTPPVITLNGTNPQIIEQGAGYTELNATTNDGSTITINSANFTDLVGTYHIYYDSTDTAGNNAIQVNRTVTVSDTTPPTFSSAVLNEGTGIFTVTFSETINASSINSTGFTIRDNNTSTDVITLSTLELTTTANGTTISFNMTLTNRQSVIAFNVSVLDISAGAVQDINGNAITLSANNIITTTFDTTPPVISLIGENPQTIELGDGYTELNATTSDGSPVTINSANFTDAVGTYHIYYDSTDTAGNNAIQVNRTVTVSDTTPPVISLIGENPQTIEQGAGYTELNATTNDGSTITINSANFTDAVGTYHIYYDSTDTAGNNAIQVNRTVTVSDTTPPVISLIGENPQTIEQGAGYTELNATTSDGSTITINSANFTDAVGTYHIYYDSTDTAGNNAIQVNRTVTVSDTTPPVISLIGENPQTIEQGAGYTELNATTNDGSTITINSANFTDLVGTYHIYYDSTDTAGNNAIQVNRTVTVSDTTPPTFSSAVLNEGTGIFTVTFSETINTSSINSTGFSIRDNNTSTDVITLSTLELTTTANGTTISFNMTLTNRQSVIAFNVSVLDISAGAVQDINGNAITLSANNIITTTFDTTPPVISLIGENPQTIELGDGYTELNATTSDGSPVTINSANFTDAVGTYHIYYDSTDTAGNNAIQVNRTVTVSDTTPPVISLIGENPQTIEQGAGYTELNATTNDGSPVTINSANFTDAVGTYHIYYDSTDTAGNNAIQVNRTVTVSDTTPPVISLIGENPQTIEQGAGYTELNATTNDGSPVTINSANFTDLVGTYHIYYDSTDTAGNNAIQVNRTVTVSDTTPPTFSSAVLNEGTGIFTVTFSETINASSINSTGFSIRDNNTSTDVITLSTLELTTTANGTTISFNMTLTNRQSVIAFNVSVLDISAGAVQDINGNAITLSANNIITTTFDTTPPVISLIGENPQTIELGDGYTELNATTSDGSPVTINSANFTDAVGTYTIYYDSTDTAGNNAIQVNRTVTVSDTTPPVISLIGENPQTIEQGAGYTELNATTNDGSPVTINSANFTDAVGTYYIYYDSVDISGNVATQVIRTLNVSDTIPPTFSSAVLNVETGVITIIFSETINVSTINPIGLSIRDNNSSAVTLSVSELITTTNGRTISFNMSQTKLASVTAFTTSVLDIDVAAVSDISGNEIITSTNNPIRVTTLPHSHTPCHLPGSGDWVITTSCMLSTNYVTLENVIVRNNSVLVILDEITLDIDFLNNNLTIESGSGVFIESGGTIT